MRTIELAVAVFAVAASGGVAGDELPLTPWGDPDIEGTYTGAAGSGCRCSGR